MRVYPIYSPIMIFIVQYMLYMCVVVMMMMMMFVGFETQDYWVVIEL
jgi:hypothetical protein